MKYILSLTLLSITLVSTCFAQKAEVFTDFNIGFFSHQPLKSFHKGLADQIPFNNLKTSGNFNMNYGFSLGFKINSIKTSFFFQNKVSGSKTSVADYSGHIRLTDELKGYTFGGIYEFDIQKFSSSSLSVGVKGLITGSKLIVKTESKISNTIEASALNFKSTDFGTGAVLIYRYPVKTVTFRATLGVDFYLGGKLKFEDIEDAHLLDEKGNKVTTGWSGLNLGIGVSIPLAR